MKKFILNTIILAIFVFVFVTICMILCFVQSKPKKIIRPLSFPMSGFKMEYDINRFREENNLSFLYEDQNLCSLAKERADYLNNNPQDWSHNGFFLLAPGFFHQNKYIYNRIGENLAVGFSSEENILTAWLNSKTHRDNLEKKEYNTMCVAINSGYVVLILGQKI